MIGSNSSSGSSGSSSSSSSTAMNPRPNSLTLKNEVASSLNVNLKRVTTAI